MPTRGAAGSGRSVGWSLGRRVGGEGDHRSVPRTRGVEVGL